MIEKKQSVEAVMLSLILCIGLNIEGQAMQSNVIEFSQADELNNWLIVNDTVMGGRSQSIAQSQDRNLHFVGELSLRNNGGFASIRRVHEPLEWHTNTPIQITVKGDGREYQFRLRTNRYMDGVAYVKSFATLKDEWQTISFQEKDFTPQFRGRLVKNADALNFSNITQLGFMLADKQAGTFELLLKEIVQSNPVAVVSEF